MSKINADNPAYLDIELHEGSQIKVYFKLTDDEGVFVNPYILVSDKIGDEVSKIDDSNGLIVSDKEIVWVLDSSKYTHAQLLYQGHFFDSSVRTIHGRLIINDALTNYVE